MTPNSPAELAEPPSAPSAPSAPPAPPAPSAPSVPAQPVHVRAALPEAPLSEQKGCLYALSQPPLMLFLAFIAVLLAVTGAHDLLLG